LDPPLGAGGYFLLYYSFGLADIQQEKKLKKPPFLSSSICCTFFIPFLLTP
jgi:hypothetical protein